MTNPADKKRILVIEDDTEVSELLSVYFDREGYEVSLARSGEEALAMVRKEFPHVVLLDIMLPGIDGYDVCKKLRQTKDTSHIPIIFLTQKDERTDKIKGLELGADDYITKPFNIDELNLRLKNAIDREERENQYNVIDGIPGMMFVKDKLRDLQKTNDAWTYVDVKIRELDAFQGVYGNLASGEVLKLTIRILCEAIDELGTENDFVGELSRGNYALITHSNKADQIEEQIINRFNVEVILHYSNLDRQQRYMVLPNGEKRPLMTMSTQSTHQFPIEGIDIF